MDSGRDTPLLRWVAPFGDPWINARSRLPKAFRSVPRPSSPLGAKASTRCPSCPSTPPAATAPLIASRSSPTEPAARRGPRPPAHSADEEGSTAAAFADQRQLRTQTTHKHTHAKTASAQETERPRRGHGQRPCRHPSPGTPGHASRRPKERAPSSPPHDVQRTRPQPQRRSQPNGLPGGPPRGVRWTEPGNQATNTRRLRPQGTGDGGLVGLGRLERPTSRLSGVRSNQLSYRPESHPQTTPSHPLEDRAGPSRPSLGCLFLREGCADGGGPLPPWAGAVRRRAGSPLKSSQRRHDRTQRTQASWGPLERR